MKLVIIFLIIASSAFAQVLDNSAGEAFTDKPFFNKTFIANNRVKSIKGQFNYKKSGQAMYPTQYFYAYNFNEQGQLISTYETRKDDGTVDTTWNEYKYNDRGLLIEHKQGTRTGKQSTFYRLNEQDQIVAEEHYTESVDTFGVKSVLLMNSESFDYMVFGLQTIKTINNSYGLPYMTETTFHDENGYLLEKELKYIRTSKFIKYLYSYNEKGLLAKIATYEKGIVDPVEEVVFKYDALGNISEKHLYKKGEYITETQVLYNEKSKLMTAVIIRDVKTDFLMVIRFTDYEFYQ